MTEIQLTAGAIEHLRALAPKQGIPTPNTPELQCLWEHRFVMGSHDRTHVTAQGKIFIQRLIAGEKKLHVSED